MEVGNLKLLVLVVFLFVVLAPRSSQSAAVPGDSVGVQIVNGQRFLVHKVGLKETHFVLARRYGVPVQQIMAANPQYKAGLKAGELVLVPRKAAAKTVAKGPQPAAPQYYKLDEKGNKIHQVAGKQTLFSIAQQYQVKPADIKKWNNLTSDGVQAGQKLIIGLAAPKINKTVIAEQPENKTPAVPTVAIGTPVTVVNQVETKNNEPEPVVATPLTRITQVSESGIAETIDSDVNKYLALHHAAPVGTYITVTNPMNGRSISARVIGQLPETGANEKIIVKLSKKAQRRLAAIDNRFRVDVSYSQVQTITTAN